MSAHRILYILYILHYSPDPRYIQISCSTEECRYLHKTIECEICWKFCEYWISKRIFWSKYLQVCKNKKRVFALKRIFASTCICVASNRIFICKFVQIYWSKYEENDVNKCFANIVKHANMKQIRSVFAYIHFEAKKNCEFDALVCNVNIYGNLKSENSQNFAQKHHRKIVPSWIRLRHGHVSIWYFFSENNWPYGSQLHMFAFFL